MNLIVDPGNCLIQSSSRLLFCGYRSWGLLCYHVFLVGGGDWNQQDWSSSSESSGWRATDSPPETRPRRGSWSNPASSWPESRTSTWPQDSPRLVERDNRTTLGMKHPLALDDRKELLYQLLMMAAPAVRFPRMCIYIQLGRPYSSCSPHDL